MQQQQQQQQHPFFFLLRGVCRITESGTFREHFDERMNLASARKNSD
jgi:hypothetical protein